MILSAGIWCRRKEWSNNKGFKISILKSETKLCSVWHFFRQQYSQTTFVAGEQMFV